MTIFSALHHGLRIGDRHIFNYAWHTEYAGPGRIAAFRFFGGAGYVWRPCGRVRGFTVSIRLRRGLPGKYRTAPPPPLVSITRNPNKYYPH